MTQDHVHKLFLFVFVKCQHKQEEELFKKICCRDMLLCVDRVTHGTVEERKK